MVRHTVTGTALELPPGVYLVQVELPSSGPVPLVTSAIRITLIPGERLELKLDRPIAQGRHLLDQAHQLWRTAQAAGVVALESSRAAGRGVAGAVAEAAPLAVPAIASAFSYGMAAFQAGEPVLPAIVASPVVSSLAGGMRQVAGAVAAAGAAVRHELLGLMSTAEPSTADPAEIEAAAVLSPDRAILRVTSAPVDAVLPRLRAGVAFGRVTRVRVDGEPVQVAPRGRNNVLTIVGPAVRAMCLVPVDPLAPNGTLVDIWMLTPASILGQDLIRPQTMIRFARPALADLWTFLSTKDFQNARRIAVAQANAPAFADEGRSALQLALCAHALLRANLNEELIKTAAMLDGPEGEDPDWLVLRAEIAARQGLHADAIRSLTAVGSRCPTLRPGVAYGLQRLRLYRRMDEDSEAEYFRLSDDERISLRQLETSLAPIAASMDMQQLNVVISLPFSEGAS